MEALGIETLCCNRCNRSIATIRVVIARSQLQRQRPVCCPLRLSIGDSSRIERARAKNSRGTSALVMAAYMKDTEGPTEDMTGAPAFFQAPATNQVLKDAAGAAGGCL